MLSAIFEKEQLKMTVSQLKKSIVENKADEALKKLCAVSEKNLNARRKRLADACDSFEALFANAENAVLLSVGGRSEISGNHTDHNRGRVIAAAVDLDIIAVAAPAADGVVTVKSEGFDADVVPPEDVAKPKMEKYFTSAAIIAGMERAFLDRGLKVGGFTAYTTSNVFKGSGLSSSAAFEVMIGNILNHLYNDGKVSNVEIAKMAQFAENEYFGKPCGLMDQTACAVGGFITIDFENPENPQIEKLDFDLTQAGYDLCIVDTGGNHADLNEDYASVPAEMKAVAAFFGKSVLREVTPAELYEKAPEIRKVLGDRALLRAFHFSAENDRVDAIRSALKKGDTAAFLRGILKSGASSYQYLQNVYTVKNVREQGLSLALCLTESFFADKCADAAWRVHGGGFAGTVQAFVPGELTGQYKEYIERVFGEGSCHVLSVRAGGAVRIL